MTGVSAMSGQVPRGLRLIFVVLTAVAAAVAGAAAARGVWFIVVVAALMAVGNLAVLRATRPSRAPEATPPPGD